MAEKTQVNWFWGKKKIESAKSKRDAAIEAMSQGKPAPQSTDDKKKKKKTK